MIFSAYQNSPANLQGTKEVENASHFKLTPPNRPILQN